MGTQGVFGIPLEVAATYIILFTIYSAVLEYSGATRFFLDLSFAAFGQSRAGPGRTVTLAGFLLGTVSGSGVATTVALGGVSWPLLRRSGYPREEAGGVLAAAGIGALLSPPTLGAAAFLIAELLSVPYLDILIWATDPDGPLLPRHRAGDRDGCAALQNSRRWDRGAADGQAAAPVRGTTSSRWSRSSSS